jgi:MoaA/NifB/PqqE/SkfB family radical SAM enzyme
MLQVAWNAVAGKKLPISLVHFVTGQCNARCSHCFVDFEGPAADRANLSLEQIVELTKHLGGSLYNVNLTGGEPFLRRDLWEIAEAYYQNAGVHSIMITSNGYYTERTREFVHKFLASPFAKDKKLMFSFSVDSFPEKHDQIRKVKGLFAKVIETYRMLEGIEHDGIMMNVAITVTDRNFEDVQPLYAHLRDELSIKAFTATAMREAGVVKKIEFATKQNIHSAYVRLVEEIHRDRNSGKTTGYKKNLQGRLMNAKNKIMNDIINDTYLEPQYRSHCPAAAMFGVIGNDGTVYPCEILDRPLGNVQDYGMNLLQLWEGTAAESARTFIRDSKCNCTYECAWAINIISNPKYYPALILNAVR